MADFDKIVRPFQLKNVAIPERILTVNKSAAPIKLQFGKSGSGKQGSSSYSLEGKYYKDIHMKETKTRN